MSDHMLPAVYVERYKDSVNKTFLFEATPMRTYIAIVERCPETGLYLGWIPGVAGAHSQAESLDDLRQNLQEVVQMLEEDGNLHLESEFVGTQVITVA